MNKRYSNSGSRIHPTRFDKLGYGYFGVQHWQFVDRETGETIGPVYPLRSELEADISRFALERGFGAEQGPSKIGDFVNVGKLGECKLLSIESSHTIVVEKAGRFYRVSGLDLSLAAVEETDRTTLAELWR